MKLSTAVLVFALAATAVSPATATAGPDPVPVPDGRPNVLIFVTDDQRAEDFLPVMPNVRRLFQEEGTRFTRAFATTPLCCPSRASIFSGRYAHNHGVLVNDDPSSVRRFDHEHTIQCGLQGAGYRTAIAGKFFNSWRLANPPPCFGRWATFNAGYQDPTFNVDGVVRPFPGGYSTDLIEGFAGGFLDAFEAEDEAPWFLYVSPFAPHFPFTTEPAHALGPVPPWEPNPAVTEQDRTDKPPVVQRKELDPARGEHMRQAQLRSLMSVDDLVGEVFDRLRELGEEERTLAIFLSDNGFLWGEHGIHGTKRFPYLPSVQVPFLMRWPAHLGEGAVDDRLVANIDIAPTIFEAAGVPALAEPGFDGTSLFGPARRDRLLLEYAWSQQAATIPAWAGTLTDTFQYVEWYADDGSVVFREYYDLTTDPFQLENLLGDADPANDPDVAGIAATLVADRACQGETCPRPAVLFADAFDTGLDAWEERLHLTISSTTGGGSPPSVRASVLGAAAFGVHVLDEPQASVCMGAAIDLYSIATATTLMRLRTSDGEGLVQVLATRDRGLRVRDELGRRAFDPDVALPTGWHRVDLCAAVGEPGTIRLALDGTVLGEWAIELGTEPIGMIQIFDDGPKTFAADLDDVSVVTDRAAVPAAPSTAAARTPRREGA